MGGYVKSDVPRFVTGIGAAALACMYFVTNWPDHSISIASFYFIFACAFDTLKAKIPNILNASLAIAGLAFFFHADGWPGLINGLSGLVFGVGLLLLPWLMGGMGAGDVKALGALGALLGPGPLIHVFIYMGLIGGVMAILHYLFERKFKEKSAEWLVSIKAAALTSDPNMIIPTKTESLRFPYAAAIAFGYYTYLSFGAVF